MQWTNTAPDWIDTYGMSEIAPCPGVVIRIEAMGQVDAHQWLVTMELLGTIREYPYNGYIWNAKRFAYRRLHEYTTALNEALNAIYPTVTGIRSPAPEVG